MSIATVTVKFEGNVEPVVVEGEAPSIRAALQALFEELNEMLREEPGRVTEIVFDDKLI